uniref:DoxX family protein n=1 Tax=Roseivirga sp. TaxID=1964215 RepID=UPI0040486EF2
MKKILWIPYPTVILLIRVFLGFIFFGAGMSKLYFEHKFPGIIGPVWLEDELAPYGLGLYARFIAGSQIIVGLLLLTQRFATLGAVLLFPVLLNILMVTISLEWRGTPYVNGFFLLLNTWLLLYDWPKLKFIFSDRTEIVKPIPLTRQSNKADKIWIGLCSVIIFTVPISYYNLNLAWIICAIAVIGIMINQVLARKSKNKIEAGNI